jgi:hypothetical protein
MSSKRTKATSSTNEIGRTARGPPVGNPLGFVGVGEGREMNVATDLEATAKT